MEDDSTLLSASAVDDDDDEAVEAFNCIKNLFRLFIMHHMAMLEKRGERICEIDSITF